MGGLFGKKWFGDGRIGEFLGGWVRVLLLGEGVILSDTFHGSRSIGWEKSGGIGSP